ncbi:50S ribosomal protein L6 [Vitreimonas sp.]|jgi:large subunit ribosomal protein L6|uniref:50S ribosomal protein L6 n=1 Tax=Vitreimonas sp. TaxID=3069702 RepID=UPI002ED991D9
MSRLGKKPIPAPNGVTVTVKGQEVSVKGPKGTLNFRAHDDVEVAFGNGELTVKPRHETPRARALWGTTRAVLANNVKGVSEGFEKNLEMTGVGYRAAMQGKNLQMQLGYSHEIIYQAPEGITLATPKPTEIKVSGIDPQAVGQAAAEIRSYRPPEPYKGKGVRYVGERIRRKEGKKK